MHVQAPLYTVLVVSTVRYTVYTAGTLTVQYLVDLLDLDLFEYDSTPHGTPMSTIL